jgi:hypothetical protein
VVSGEGQMRSRCYDGGCGGSSGAQSRI